MMEKPNRPQRNRRHSRRAWPPEDDLHYPRAAKRLFTPEIKRMLKEWLVRRRENPYPSRDEKKRLAIDTGLTYTQICNWFANWRRKLKNAEREKSKKSWGHLIKNYNTNAKGNVEQFSISSEDSIWEEEEQQYRRHHHHRSDNENEDDDLDSMCDIDGSSGGSTDTTERNGTGSSTISSGFGGEEGGIHMTGVNHKTNIYNINNAMALHKDPSELFIGREVDVLTTNASCQITQSAANVGTKTKYKQKMMEKYLRDTYDTNSTPINSTMVHIGFNDQQTSTDNPQHATATVYCNGSNTTIIKSGAELSKWLESAAKFTPNKNNYFIEWNSKRNKNDKKPLLVTTTTKSFPVSNPNNGDAQQTSVTVVPILYSTTPATVQITNSPNTTNSHLQQQQLENEHIYNSIHHKDELDAAEALANLAFNCRQRMLDANVTAGCTFQRPLNAISS
ncbi:uncharacterized protein LOC101895148 [Musca domestica]|uniref:Uncharacterized protein LOC101895148 n=1 Tax=Musca domestica TaxID=7370 RepID=A0A1I8N4C7_MUSDO|nr:uncharacterized protein LOC101895148 [Musca domestica]